MTRAQTLVHRLLDDAPTGNGKAAPAEHRVYTDEWEAAASVPPSGWREWQEAGVSFSRFHIEGTPFELPFRPDDYLWAGPFTLKMPKSSNRWGYYRRGVKKYLAMLAKGLKLPPVLLLQQPGGWTLQDGSHRFEALMKARVATYDAFLGKPKKKKPIGEF